MVTSGRSRGGDARTHNLPLTGIYKVIFAQNLAFVRTYTFRMKSMESFKNEAPDLNTAQVLLTAEPNGLQLPLSGCPAPPLCELMGGVMFSDRVRGRVRVWLGLYLHPLPPAS